jgi:hypothetical protein
MHECLRVRGMTSSLPSPRASPLLLDCIAKALLRKTAKVQLPVQGSELSVLSTFTGKTRSLQKAKERARIDSPGGGDEPELDAGRDDLNILDDKLKHVVEADLKLSATELEYDDVAYQFTRRRNVVCDGCLAAAPLPSPRLDHVKPRAER